MTEEKKDDYRKMSLKAFRVSFWFGTIALFSLLLYAAAAAKPGAHWYNLLGVLFTIAFAGLATGGLIGFLFGIPHTLANTGTPTSGSNPSNGQANAPTGGSTITSGQVTTNNSSNAPSSPTPATATVSVRSQSRSTFNLRPSTNLEQIADWLTKIIVGVGLVEIHKIIIYFNQLCLSLGDTIQNYTAVKTGGTIAGAIIVIFIAIGFLIVYLWTYLYLIVIQSDIQDPQGIIDSIKDEIRENDENDKKAIDLANMQLTLSLHAADLPVAELMQAFKAASRTVVSSIFFRAVTVRKQCWRDPQGKYRIAKTIPVFKALIGLDTTFEFPENYLELAYALKDKDNPDYVAALDNLNTGINGFANNTRIKYKEIAYFNRAYCRVKLDNNYRQAQPQASTAENQKLIKDDLAAASTDPYVNNIISTDPLIADWKSKNP